MSYQKVIMIGRLGVDPDIWYSGTGRIRTEISLGTTRPRRSGEKTETEITWHKVVLWGKQAEAANMYLHKGSRIMVEGYLHYRKINGADGLRYNTAEVVAERVIFLDNKPKN